MLVPPALFRPRPAPRLAALAPIGAMLIVGACSLLTGYGQGSPEPSASAASSSLPTPAPSSRPVPTTSKAGDSSTGPCQPAPDWLTAAVVKGLAVPGATLSEVYVGAASITSGPPVVTSGKFQPAWWIVARISGAGVRPVAAIWVTNRTTPGSPGDIFAANPAALRSSTFGQGGSIPIQGDGQAPLLGCLTPIPDS